MLGPTAGLPQLACHPSRHPHRSAAEFVLTARRSKGIGARTRTSEGDAPSGPPSTASHRLGSRQHRQRCRCRRIAHARSVSCQRCQGRSRTHEVRPAHVRHRVRTKSTSTRTGNGIASNCPQPGKTRSGMALPAAPSSDFVSPTRGETPFDVALLPNSCWHESGMPALL